MPKQIDRIDRDISKLRNDAQKRFGWILRDLCEASGFTQGKLAKEAKAERKRLIEQGYINPGDLIGSMEQPAISRVMAGAQEPTYFQVFIWLRVMRKHYESETLARKCRELKIEKPEFPEEIEQALWDLTSFRRPEDIARAYKQSEKIEPTRLSIIDHKETRMHSRQNTSFDLAIAHHLDRRRDTTAALPAITSEGTAVKQ